MKKNLKRLAAMTLTAALAVSVTACSSSKNTGDGAKDPESVSKTAESSGQVPETTLKIYMFGGAENQDKVLNKFYEQTKDTLNTKLDFVWSPASDYIQNIPLLIQNKQEADLVFDAYWMNLSKMKNEGAYADISKYFNNDEYPGLKAAFPESVIGQVREPDGAIYTVPLYEVADDQSFCFFIRKDLREKYHLPEVRDLDTFRQYCDAMEKHKAEEGLVAPIGLAERGFFKFQDRELTRRANHIFGIPNTGANATMEIQALLNEEGTKVLAVAGIGDPDEAFAEFPEPFHTNYMDARYVELAETWKPYVQKDSNVEQDAKKNLFYTGKVAAVEGALDGYGEVAREIENFTGIKDNVEVFLYDEVEQKRDKIVKNNLTTNNFLCIPYYSTKIDQTMKFLDWIYSNRANHDLFQYGIEGEDWTAVGDSQYESLNADNKYVFPGYQLTWNPNYARIEKNLPEKIKDYYENYVNLPDNYTESPIAGFVFNAGENSEVKRAYAAYTNVQTEYYSTLANGIYGDQTEKVIGEYYKKAQAAGMETVKEAVKRQLQEYLDSKNK
ncbi:ABC transporter substrate-binding protein [Lacrimispora sp. JR3]|uniref:ABC transporter substrate-binding protein n=1 Tax=Lacrimispora sinapis TaxID=3111456 RepID=UPI003749E8DB